MGAEVECPVFHPTAKQFANFDKYLASIAPEIARIGLCKVVPPKEWAWEIVDDATLDKLTIQTPIKQIINGRTGIYNIMNCESKDIPVPEYKKLVDKPTNQLPNRCLAHSKDVRHLSQEDVDAVERAFWKSLTTTRDAPVYGADVSGSLFKDANVPWNVSALDCVLRKSGVGVQGVTIPMLYFGMWRAIFSMHNEDMNLFSINYLHAGAPKIWYAIPPDANNRLESLAQSIWPEEYLDCRQFLRHKTKLLSPQRLQQNGIPYTRCLHKQGEFMITWASSYHFGFNLGFNCAESVNFIPRSWCKKYVEYGRKAKPCKCRPGAVHIDMTWFEENILASPPKKERATVKDEVELADQRENPPKKRPRRNARLPVLGDSVWFLIDPEKEPIVAKIVAVEGEFVRVHVPGTAKEKDEWLEKRSDVLVGVVKDTDVDGKPPRGQKAKPARKRPRAATQERGVSPK